LFLTLTTVKAQTDFPSLKQQYLDFRKADKQDSALYIARKMNKLALNEQSDTSYWYALSLRYQGNVYETRGENDSTLLYMLKSLGYFDKYHQNSDDHGTSLNLLGIFNKKIGLYKSAEEFYIQSAKIRSRNGVWNQSYAYSLNNLSWLYNSMGRYSEALSLVDSSLLILQKIYLNDSLKLINELHSKAEILLNISDYDGSEKLYFQCKSLCEKNNLPLEKYIKLEKDIAQLYVKKGKYAQAEVILLQVDSLLNLKEKNKEIYQLSAEIKFTLGKIKSITGQFNEALSYYEEALKIRRTHLPKNHPDIAESLASFGVLHAKLGEYDFAHNYYQEALGILKISLGETHPKYAECLNSLGSLNLDLGDFKLAEIQMLAALEIRKKALGEEHPGYALNLSSLGRLYRNKGDYSTAEGYYKRALEIRLKIHQGEKSDNIASSTNLLGYVYLLMGRYSESETLLLDSYQMRKELEMAENPNYAMNLYNLGMLYNKLEKYNLSEEYLLQSIEIRKRLFGENNNELIASKLALSKLFLKTNRLEEAFSILEIIFNNKLENISSNFEWLGESQKELYWKKEEVFYDQLSWLANESFAISPKFSTLSYNAALVSKSKLLEAKIANDNYYREIEETREKLGNAKRIVAKMESDGINDQVLFKKSKHEADSLDKRLTQSWPEYAQQKKNLSITWDQVQQNLDISEAAIEFVRFKNEDDSLYYYNALIVKPGEKYPILVKLCKENELKLIKPTSGFSAYYPLVWQPLENVLKDVKTIYYSPTGELYNVPFHALYAQKENGDHLIDEKTNKRGVVVESQTVKVENQAEYLIDRFTMHQLTSTRYLAMGLKEKAQEPIVKSIAMVGGVNYDFLNSKEEKPKKQKDKRNSTRSSQSASGKLAYLEGTKLETETIKDSVQSKQWKIELFSSNDATEDNLMRLEGRHAKSILHIATHGYAFPEYNFNDTTVNKNSLRYSYRYSTNPMVRSGLILAGGNWAWTGSDTLTKLGAEQNGILTALEVSQLNLKKTKLVVLSACETGLGKIEGSEGTFGLKRGFKLAGVEQIIVSLWSVPDKETMELMTLFYSDLTKTLNPVISFSKAQKEMRNRYPTEPEKWAGFVLVR
jgi:CHAT domain-containing protein/tetratricopeptide (TPR) repeat protein